MKALQVSYSLFVSAKSISVKSLEKAPERKRQNEKKFAKESERGRGHVENVTVDLT